MNVLVNYNATWDNCSLCNEGALSNEHLWGDYTLLDRAVVFDGDIVPNVRVPNFDIASDDTVGAYDTVTNGSLRADTSVVSDVNIADDVSFAAKENVTNSAE